MRRTAESLFATTDRMTISRASSLLAAILTLTWLLNASVALAQTTSFTYQGKLEVSGSPANGVFDFQFKLFDSVSGGLQDGSTITVEDVQVTNGIFVVSLNFGASSFRGPDRFLEICVRDGADVGVFTLLTPRQQVTSTPYAIRSLNAGNASSADSLSSVCVGCVTSTQIHDLDGSKISGTLAVSSIPAGSTNYIQNTTTQQAASNFNISATGTANIFNAATQYNINGSRVLSIAGSSNLFAGVNAGAANTGSLNAFFGSNAGQANTSGTSNSFFGALAGQANTTGTSNAFFGRSAGGSTTTGFGNSFFGTLAGSGDLYCR